MFFNILNALAAKYPQRDISSDIKYFASLDFN